MEKKNHNKEVETIKASEPATVYASADAIAEMNICQDNEAPCVYSDDEFAKEIELSERSGFVTHADFKKSCKEKWGVEL